MIIRRCFSVVYDTSDRFALTIWYLGDIISIPSKGDN